MKKSIRKIVEEIVNNTDYDFNINSEFLEFIKLLDDELQGLDIPNNYYIGYLVSKYSTHVFHTSKQGYYLSYNDGSSKLASFR